MINGASTPKQSFLTIIAGAFCVTLRRKTHVLYSAVVAFHTVNLVVVGNTTVWMRVLRVNGKSPRHYRDINTQMHTTCDRAGRRAGEVLRAARAGQGKGE